MIQSLLALGFAFALGVALSRAFRRSLFWLRSRERKAGKEKLHRMFPKPRRPLGGGLAIMLATTAAALLVPLLWRRAPDPATLWVLTLAWAYAAIGLVDDLRKVRGQGLREKPKFLLQCLAAVGFAGLLWQFLDLHQVSLPFSPDPIEIGALYVPFAALVILAIANAVNLSDGVDGLAGGATVIALAGLVGLGLLDQGHPVPPVAWPLAGAVLGFLVYNLPPARLLMGDTGALGLGAALAALALLGRVELWFLLLGAPFVINAVSVVVQIGTVRGLWRVFRPLRHRTTETPRPFLCTPLHHHFQWLGWNDWQVLALFWGAGGILTVITVAGLRSPAVWLLGLAAEGAFLFAAALQKTLRGNYFFGLLARPNRPSLLALYRGLPVAVLGITFYRLHHETLVTEGMLADATAESILWRPISEVEAHVALGRIYADQKLFDEAIKEWEQVPTRNLLARPNTVLRLARIYYGKDRLIEAIKLWDQFPASRLQEMPNLREVVRSAKLRLADLASKSHRQSVKAAEAALQEGVLPEHLESYLITARRFNQDLLSLLLYERDKLGGRAADPQAFRTRRRLLRETRRAVLARIHQIDSALAQVVRSAPPTAGDAAVPVGDLEHRVAQGLSLDRQRLVNLIAPAGSGQPRIVRAAVHPKASRNTVFRLHLEWPDGGPSTLIAKHYTADRISFFSACYRRERGVLELAHRYGCAVPRVYGGELRDDQALLLLQDLGDETLAERLETSDARGKQHWLRSALTTLVSLHATAYNHLAALTEEIEKIDKERLGADYYLSAMRIALERIAGLSETALDDSDWLPIRDQSYPLIDLLCARPASFIHFELTPHHFLIADAGLHVFDFEQATIGPLEFDLAALLAQPESDLGEESWDGLTDYYRVCGTESGLPIDSQFDRAVAYAALFKSLVYAGAAANFLAKFGGEHHLQRLRYYIDRCQTILKRWPPLRPLGYLLGRHLHKARSAPPTWRPHTPPGSSS